jgi:drug/metabolite transporter (DMT)-like permease
LRTAGRVQFAAFIVEGPTLTLGIETWLLITVVAAFLQNVRSLLQKRLTGQLSVNGAAYVRFCYAVPFAWIYALVLWRGEFDGLNSDFFAYALLGGVAQIVGTSALLASFTAGNFAVGTAFSKTEAAQAAIFGLVVLGDVIDIWIVSGIAVSLVGVVFLSGQFRFHDLLKPNKAMLMGLLCGAGFGIAAVSFRGASLALDAGSFVQRAGLTVVAAVSMQTIIMGVFIALREPDQLSRVLKNWPIAVWVGAIGMIASAGWFTAMTLKNAAVVRAVGQVELLFTVATSVWFFQERLRAREIVGISLVVLGILLLI